MVSPLSVSALCSRSKPGSPARPGIISMLCDLEGRAAESPRLTSRNLPGEAPSHVPLLCSLWVVERPAPPRELLVPQAEVTARSLRLQWVPGSDGASPIRYFTVQVRELPEGEWQTYSSSISHEATACAVERYPEGPPGERGPAHAPVPSACSLHQGPGCRVLEPTQGSA